MKFGLRELLFFGLLIAIPIGAYYWVFKPSNENWHRQKAQIKVKELKLAELNKAACGVYDLNAEVEKLAEAVTFFESKLPAQHEIHKILEQVTKIADKQRLETRLFKTLKPEPFANYSEQPIEMEVYGDFDAYYQFLLELEKLPRITKVKEMFLVKDANLEGAMNAKFTLSIFFDSSNTAANPKAG